MRLGLFLAAAFALQSCDAGPNKPTGSTTASKPAPVNYEIAVDASPKGSNTVHFVVTTNIPLPVEVMASVALTNQNDDDIYIGTDAARRTLTQTTTEFDLNTVDLKGNLLPEGEYVGEVSFYPRWGARNEKAKGVPTIESVSNKFRLSNQSLTAAKAQRRNEEQRWVMENVISGTPWDESKFVARLGKYEKYPATLSHLHDVYYFASPDMTLIVNRLQGEVSVWRMGRATS